MDPTRTLVHRRPSRLRPQRERGPAGDEGPDLVLERYRLLERLGAGGFGVVWRARDETLGREVALKRVARDWGAARDGEGSLRGDDRARREALAAARLAHPAIAALYEARSDGGWLYLISELVRGKALSAHIAARSLADRDALRVGHAMCEALAHAHACGVIHRDVKPANIIVLDPGIGHAAHVPAKLTDFGSALLAGTEPGRASEADALTRVGDVIGTLAYMAPEQSEGLRATAASDLYALAVVLYEALAGFNPLRRTTLAATARQLGADLPALEHHRPDLPRALTVAIDRSLEPEPAARGTVAELHGALGEALAGRWRARAGGALVPRRQHRAQATVEGALATIAGSQATARQTLTARAREGAGEGAAYPAGPRRLRAPRALWWGAALAAIAWQALAGRGGAAVVVAALALPLLALPRRAGPGWLLAAFAPLLGGAGLAGAFPALAGQWRRWHARAALGALGYWWVLLAQPLVGTTLWLWPGTGADALAQLPRNWAGSPARAAEHVLAPLLVRSTGEGIAAWALAAALLPLLVRGRGLARDLVGATVWAAALAGCAPLFAAGATGALAAPAPRGAIVGAIVGAIGAIVARALRGPAGAPARR